MSILLSNNANMALFWSNDRKLYEPANSGLMKAWCLRIFQLAPHKITELNSCRAVSSWHAWRTLCDARGTLLNSRAHLCIQIRNYAL
jgi:hypothetical protein